MKRGGGLVVIDVLECCRRTDLLAISSESALSLLCGIIKYLNAISALRKKKGQKEIQEDRKRERDTLLMISMIQSWDNRDSKPAQSRDSSIFLFFYLFFSLPHFTLHRTLSLPTFCVSAAPIIKMHARTFS